MRRVLFLLPAIAMSSLMCTAAHADQGANRAISGAGTLGFLGLGLLLPLAEDGHDGLVHSARELDSLLVSVGISFAVEHLTNVRAPNGSPNSFPSNHATAAFAIATMESQFHTGQAPYWYAGAAIIGISRVELHEHSWAEVITGAALGFATARFELSNHRGLLLYPFMNDDGGFGAQLSMKF